MSASQGGEPVEPVAPPTPPFRKVKAAATVVGGGTVVTALIASGVIPLAVVILGIIMAGVLTVVAIVVLKDDGESTRFDRLMCLLGMLLGRPATRFLPKRAVEELPHKRPAPVLPLQAAPLAIEGESVREPSKEDVA
ncbi:hypothetical protein [Nonomuraea sp. 10N515B]|uniref:hypothetical protein n=1 Tax=Nonomuraea sp. 10N515B TaxID=3457422 RepID=UPI003FCDDEAC